MISDKEAPPAGPAGLDFVPGLGHGGDAKRWGLHSTLGNVMQAPARTRA